MIMSSLARVAFVWLTPDQPKGRVFITINVVQRLNEVLTVVYGVDVLRSELIFACALYRK